ncbi:MAG: hypothetical protein OXG29_09780 [Gammaproteobacteria bacterium]|nr:hypothetical protein [Gammaproteobacteria bacterium]
MANAQTIAGEIPYASRLVELALWLPRNGVQSAVMEKRLRPSGKVIGPFTRTAAERHGYPRLANRGLSAKGYWVLTAPQVAVWMSAVHKGLINAQSVRKLLQRCEKYLSASAALPFSQIHLRSIPLELLEWETEYEHHKLIGGM